MGEQWGTVVAAAIGFGGLFVGLFVGRRQVTDEAQVEHGQWLRGQRQEAYAQLLDVWDKAFRETLDVTNHPESHHEAHEQRGHDWETEVGPHIQEIVAEAWEPVLRAVERVELLGPSTVMEATEYMRATGEEIQAAASDVVGRWPKVERSARAEDQGRRARWQAVSAYAAVMQQAPRPGAAGRFSLRRGR
ncbi:hypothetical protein [Streptomyces clavifer]|uniref:hypothetical protein n=1 Tax=Streptomyces clavifer TaxID=68188 RepID=UPI0033F24179